MNPIQILLVAAFAVLLIWFFARQNSHQIRAWLKIAVVLFSMLAVFVILSPNNANAIAHLVGVGRGADLLLYILTVVFVFTLFNSYVTHKRDQRRLVTLARKLALLEATMKYKNDR